MNAASFGRFAGGALVIAVAGCPRAWAAGVQTPFSEPPVALVSPAAPGSGEPRLAVGPDGAVYLSWFEKLAKGHALKLARLEGVRWSKPVTVASGDSFFVNWADFPSLVVVGGKRLAIAWPWKRGGSPYAYDVRVAQSPDGGRSWGRFTVPHRDGTPTEHGFISLVPAGEAVRAVWLDGRKFPVPKPGESAHGHDDEPQGEMTLRSARVGSDGALSEEAELDARVCDCCQTGATVSEGGVLVAYRDRGDKEVRDISIVRLENGVWSPPMRVSADDWEIPACPVNGPAVDARGPRVAVAWFTAGGGRARVRVAFSSDGGRSFGAPIDLPVGDPLGRVDLVQLDDGAALVSWMDAIGKEAEVRVARVTPAGEVGEMVIVARTSAARASGFPRMVHSGRRVIVAWTEVGSRSQVKLAAASLR